jgi:hypothetical protein
MEPYNEVSSVKYNKLNANDNWLRKRQGLALPALPPTTPEARKYFFSKIRHFATLASENGHGKINYEAFAQEWNQSADGQTRFYVTTEVLSAYAKSWEKASNIRASQELIKGKMDGIQQTANSFAAPLQLFPAFLTSTPTSVHPRQGAIDLLDDPTTSIPPSILTELAISLPPIEVPHSIPLPARELRPMTPRARPEIHDHVMVFDQQDHPDPGTDLAGPALGIMPGFADNQDGPVDDSFESFSIPENRYVKFLMLLTSEIRFL